MARRRRVSSCCPAPVGRADGWAVDMDSIGGAGTYVRGTRPGRHDQCVVECCMEAWLSNGWLQRRLASREATSSVNHTATAGTQANPLLEVDAIMAGSPPGRPPAL